MSELAIAPPHVAWDPDFLLEIDPRYVETPADDDHDDHEEGSEVVWNSEDEETYYQSDEYTDIGMFRIFCYLLSGTCLQLILIMFQ